MGHLIEVGSEYDHSLVGFFSTTKNDIRYQNVRTIQSRSALDEFCILSKIVENELFCHLLSYLCVPN